MLVTISPLAELDLEAIADHIAADNPVRAVSFVQELRAQCQRIARNPPGYRQRLELGNDIRSCAHGNYVIFFAAEPDHIAIIRILHGARDIPAILAEDGDEP